MHHLDCREDILYYTIFSPAVHFVGFSMLAYWTTTEWDLCFRPWFSTRPLDISDKVHHQEVRRDEVEMGYDGGVGTLSHSLNKIQTQVKDESVK